MKLSKHTVIVFGTLSISFVSACIPAATDNSPKDASLAGSGGATVSAGGGGKGGSAGSAGDGGAVSTGGSVGSGGSAGSSSATTATGGSKSTSAALGGSTTQAVDSGTSTSATTCQAGCATLPLVVDGKDSFVPSGYMGDWNGIKEVSSGTDASACPTRAHDGAVGYCHHWTWSYSNGVCATAADPQAVCGKWACVAWLKPYNLFTDPTKPGPSGGLPVAAGATKVRFWAWAPKPTSIRFSVGSGSDGVSGSVTGSLTTTPAKFEIDISMSSYNVVNNGFQWCANDTGATSTEFYVDDIQWI